jgi:hypothetical protein
LDHIRDEIGEVFRGAHGLSEIQAPSNSFLNKRGIFKGRHRPRKENLAGFSPVGGASREKFKPAKAFVHFGKTPYNHITAQKRFTPFGGAAISLLIQLNFLPRVSRNRSPSGSERESRGHVNAPSFGVM